MYEASTAGLRDRRRRMYGMSALEDVSNATNAVLAVVAVVAELECNVQDPRWMMDEPSQPRVKW